MKTRKMIMTGLAITIAATALSMVPKIATARSCDAGKASLLYAGVRLTGDMSVDKYDLEVLLASEKRKLSTEKQRLVEPFLRGARLNLYTPMSMTKKEHPETPAAVIESVLWSCKASETLIIPYPALNRLAIAELCDFSKSIVTTESSVVCVIAHR